MDPLADGEGGIVMNATSDSEQKEVLELLLGRQGDGDQGSISVALSSDTMGSAPYDPVAPLPELPASTMHGDDEDDDDASAGAASGTVTQLHIGEVDEVDDDEVMQVMQAHIKQEGEDDSDPAMSLSLCEGTETATAGVMITADGQLLFTPQPDPATSSDTPDGTSVQTITLPDGSTAYLQQNTKDASSFQAVELEDGTTALVSAGNVAVPQKQADGESGVINAKFLEGQTVQLEDGSTAFIQAANPKASQNLHPVQLEDGSTAYLTTNLFAGDQIDPNELIQQHHASELPGQRTGVTISDFPTAKGGPSRAPSERALALGEKAYKCTYEGCGRLYTTQHHLKIHERSHTGDKPFKCEMENCNRAFATSYGLKSHVRVHTGEKPYKCPIADCMKAFKTSGDLQKHIRTHTGEKPFKCPFEGCDRAFTTSNIRKVHIRTHTGERPYVCSYKDCKKTFASATNYKNHIRIHSGEKPYVCTVPGCGKRFTEYSSLYKHHVVHTHTKPYECGHCGKTYRQTSTLAMHRRTAHGEDVGEEGDGTVAGGVAHGLDLVLGPGLDAAMEDASTSSLTIKDQSQENEDEDSLVINTSSDAQKRQGGAKLTILANGTSSAGDTATTITPMSLHNQPGLALADLSGQQIFVVTDPTQLEMIQQLTQQANFVLQAPDSSASSSTQSESLKTESSSTLAKSDLLEATDTATNFLNTE